MKKQSFLKGAIILMAANAVSKILGAVFKIPLTYILGEEGMAVFNTSFSVYTSVLAFIISGMPVASAKIISEEYALGHTNAVRRTVGVSAALLCVMGLIGTGVLYMMSHRFAYAVNDMQSAAAIRAIAPSVFFVALGVVYKSFCQGTRYMTPIGVSQVTEAVIKLAAGYAIAVYMLPHGIGAAAAGAVGGITVGEITATGVLMMMSRLPKRIKGEKTEKTISILKRIFNIAFPVMVASSITGALSFIGVAMIRTRLCEILFDVPSAVKLLAEYSDYTPLFDTLLCDMRINADGARWLYGAYSGYALTIFHLPTGIIGALSMGIFPLISSASATGNVKKIRTASESAVRMTVIMSLPCAVVMYFFSKEILMALFGNCASAPMLRTLAPCVVTACIAQICTSVLHGVGKINTTLVYSIFVCAAEIVIGWVLIGNPYINILGASYALCICTCIEAVAAVVLCKKYAYLRIRFSQTIIKPIIAVCAMLLVMNAAYEPLRTVLVRDLYALCVCGMMGCAVYALVLVLTGSVTLSDIGIVKRSRIIS